MSLKNRMKDYGMDNYEMLMQLAIEGYTYLNIYATSSYNVVYLKLDDKNVIDLPPDFIDYTKIAINLCGRFYTLSLNDNLIPPKGMSCGIPLDKVAQGCCERGVFSYPDNGYYFVPHYKGDTSINTFYAMGGGWSQAGQYRIDRNERQLIITGVPKTEIVMEYKSSGVNVGEKTFVPIQCREAVVAWIRWQLALEGHNNIHPDRAYEIFLQEESIMKALDFSRTYSEYMDVFYRTWKQGPKR